MSLVARGDRVIVKPETPSIYQHHGLYVTDQDAPDVMGTVVAVGEACDVNLDDVVIFTESAGQVLEYEGERYLVMREDEILGVWE